MKDRKPSMGRVASFVGVITVTGLLAACGGDESQPPPAAPEVRTELGAMQEQRLPHADLGKPLEAPIEAVPTEGAAPLRVQFNVRAQGGTPPLEIALDFGDGSSPESTARTAHTYTKPGLYRAAVDVSDAAGDTASEWVQIKVR